MLAVPACFLPAVLCPAPGWTSVTPRRPPYCLPALVNLLSLQNPPGEGQQVGVKAQTPVSKLPLNVVISVK